MTSPVLTFGQHAGKTIDQVPDSYVRWLVAPERVNAVARNGRRFKPIDPAIIAAAQARMPAIEERARREAFANRCMGGHPTGLASPTYVIEVDGDGHMNTGRYALDGEQFDTLDLALEALSREYPVELRDGDLNPTRSTPDPEDDLIAVWEVLPSGHRRPVWAFMGWHHGSKQDNWACGQGTLPGDTLTLYELASADY